MQTFIWERPAFNSEQNRTGKSCKICGSIALYEYCKTFQYEPRNLTVFVPVCFNCKQNNRSEFEELLNRALYPMDLKENEKGEVFLVVDSEVLFW